MARLFFHTAFVGDLLLSIPAIRRIRESFPSDELIIVTRPKVGEFFRHFGLGTHVFELEKSSRKSVRELRKFLRGFEITEVIAPHQSFRTAWILKDIAAGKKISYSRIWNFPFFNIRIPRRMDWPEPLRVLDLVGEIDSKTRYQLNDLRDRKKFLNSNDRDIIRSWGDEIPTEFLMTLAPRPSDVTRVQERLRLRSPFAVIAPSSQWVTKRWTEEGFAKLLDGFIKRGLNIYVVGSAAEKAQCERVVSLANLTGSQLEVRSLAGETNLVELHALMSLAQFAVTNDSGPMHMATVAGIPVVGIFGPTTLDLGYRPWGNNVRVAQKPLPCRPCGRHGHNRCPIGTHDCMKQLSADDVASLIF